MINIKNHQGTLLRPLTTIHLQRVAGGKNVKDDNSVESLKMDGQVININKFHQGTLSRGDHNFSTLLLSRKANYDGR